MKNKTAKQVKETQERSIGYIPVGNIQDAITWLEAKKKDGWETIRYNWEKALVFERKKVVGKLHKNKKSRKLITTKLVED